METSRCSLGDRMKSYEKTEYVKPYQSFIVRCDGKNFSKFTNFIKNRLMNDNESAERFPKPFDKGFANAIVKTANGLLEFFSGVRTVFCCSDEITLIFPALCTKEEYENLVEKHISNVPSHCYNGKRNKIESLISAKCSVLFNRFILESDYSPELIKTLENRDAIFDSRLILIPLGEEIEIVNNIIWRSCYDCRRNTVSSYGRYILGHKACNNKNGTEMIEMMKNKGYDFEAETPIHYIYGVLSKKVQVTIKNDDNEYVRTKIHNFCTNLLDQDREKTLELFNDKYFSEKIKSVDFFF